METLEQLQKQLKKAQKAHSKAFDELPSGLDWYQVEDMMKPTVKKCAELSRKIRMIMPYTLSPLSEDSDVMSLKEFIQHCKSGGFIDYDGFGNYVKDGQCTDIDILPSDVTNKSIRNDFDTIVWYNR